MQSGSQFRPAPPPALQEPFPSPAFLAEAAEIPIHPEVQEFPLEAANQALRELKQRRIRGAKVLRVGPA